MTTTAIKKVTSKLKVLPDALLLEVEKYLDFLTYKYAQETALSKVPQWQKDLVLDRMNNPKTIEDAFEMIGDLEK
jgi:hypothetical protein